MPTVTRQAPIRPGEPAPDFTLAAIHREGTISLAEYRGRSPVLLAMFRGLWCSFCRRQIVQLGLTLEKLQGVGVETLAIVATNAQRARLYHRFRPTPVPLAADPELITYRAYGLPEYAGSPDEAEQALDLPRISLPGRSEQLSLREVGHQFHLMHPYEWKEADREDFRRTENLWNGQFLVDRHGIVRWVNVEGTWEGFPDLVKLPSDEELLAAARALPP